MLVRPVMIGLVVLGLSTVSFAQTPAQPGAPDFTASVTYNVGSKGGEVQNLVVTIGDGGSGPYKAILRGDPSLPTHAIYRPKDLKPFGAKLKMPIVLWGNGACRNTSGEYRNLLTEIASHGFLIVAIGPAAYAAISGGDMPGMASKSSQLMDGAEWAIAQNGRTGGEYFGKIDTTKIAVMGHSCGGAQALEVSFDPRVTTTVMWNSGMFKNPPAAPPAAAGNQPAAPGAAPGARPRFSGMPMVPKEDLVKLHAPIAYILGGKSDIAYENGMDDYAKITSVPAVVASQDVGHYPATFRDPRGGAYGIAGVAWLKWQLRGDQEAAKMFLGEKCGLCADPKWEIHTKNIK